MNNIKKGRVEKMTEEKYWQRVGRNIGVLSKEEQHKIIDKKIMAEFRREGGIDAISRHALAIIAMETALEELEGH